MHVTGLIRRDKRTTSDIYVDEKCTVISRLLFSIRLAFRNYFSLYTSVAKIFKITIILHSYNYVITYTIRFSLYAYYFSLNVFEIQNDILL
jgi:hypothetical protein